MDIAKPRPNAEGARQLPPFAALMARPRPLGPNKRCSGPSVMLQAAISYQRTQRSAAHWPLHLLHVQRGSIHHARHLLRRKPLPCSETFLLREHITSSKIACCTPADAECGLMRSMHGLIVASTPDLDLMKFHLSLRGRSGVTTGDGPTELRAPSVLSQNAHAESHARSMYACCVT